MANYTTEVRSICEVYAGNKQQQGYNAIDNIVEKAAPLVFEKFPIFDEDYRLPLEKKILRHFYTREICMETVGLWKLHFNNKMNEIMPYYNKLYESELLKFNPFWDTDLTRENDRTSDSQSESKSKNTTNEMTDLERKTEGVDDTVGSATSDRKVGENTERKQNTKEVGFSDTDNTKDIKDNSQETVNEKVVLVGEKDVSGTLEQEKDTKVTVTPKNRTTHELNKFLDTPQSANNDISNGELNSNYLTDVRDVKRTESGSEETKTSGKDTDTTNNKTTQHDTTTTNREIKDERSTKANENTTTNSENQMDTNDTHERKMTDSNIEENSRFNKHNDKLSETGTTDSESISNAKTKANNMETFFEKIRGKQGTKSYSKMLEEFRNTFLNIDMMIIKDLEPLFMGIW